MVGARPDEESNGLFVDRYISLAIRARVVFSLGIIDQYVILTDALYEAIS